LSDRSIMQPLYEKYDIITRMMLKEWVRVNVRFKALLTSRAFLYVSTSLTYIANPFQTEHSA